MFEEIGKKLSNEDFWDWLTDKVLDLGKEFVEKLLILYYAGMDPKTPPGARIVVASAIAYFVFPIDAIPDFIPGLGKLDDLGVLAAALAIIAFHIKKEHKEQAKEKMKDLFGNKAED